MALASSLLCHLPAKRFPHVQVVAGCSQALGIQLQPPKTLTGTSIPLVIREYCEHECRPLFAVDARKFLGDCHLELHRKAPIHNTVCMPARLQKRDSWILGAR